MFMRALGKRVRLLRLTAELTQEELGEAAGISRSFVSLIEHGTRGVDVVRLIRIAAVFRAAAARAGEPRRAWGRSRGGAAPVVSRRTRSREEGACRAPCGT